MISYLPPLVVMLITAGCATTKDIPKHISDNKFNQLLDSTYGTDVLYVPTENENEFVVRSNRHLVSVKIYYDGNTITEIDERVNLFPKQIK